MGSLSILAGRTVLRVVFVCFIRFCRDKKVHCIIRKSARQLTYLSRMGLPIFIREGELISNFWGIEWYFSFVFPNCDRTLQQIVNKKGDRLLWTKEDAFACRTCRFVKARVHPVW